MLRQTPTRLRPTRADQTRQRILRAAVKEFSAHGLSGARTEAIAASARANKALLYYYFKSKNALYIAAIQEVSGKVVEDALAALDPKYSAGERLLRTALNHFDRILIRQEFQSLMQQEMVRYHRGEGDGSIIPLIFRTAFKPLVSHFRKTVNEGIRTGELCRTDWLQLIYSMFGANVFYFLSAPIIQLALPIDPFAPRVIRSRRTAAIRFLGNALFTDRTHGARLAQRVLDQMPMPQLKTVKQLKQFQLRSRLS